MNNSDNSFGSEYSDPPGWLRFSTLRTVLVVLLFSAGLAANIGRIQLQYQVPAKVFDESNAGYCDFHNGVYFPSKSFAERISPYGKAYAEKYPTPRPIPFFSPSVLILHLPFAMLPLHVAEVAFFGWQSLLLMLLAWMTVRFSGMRPTWQQVLLVASFILFSRAGHTTIYNGYFTFELVVGTLVALQFAKTKPFLSAAGLLLASGKPTYVIPLGLVMLARGNWRAVIYGGIISAAVAGAGFGWLASTSSVNELIEGVKQGQMEHLEDPVEFPVHTWLRVDLPAIICKWLDLNPGELVQLVMMCFLIAPICFVIWRNRVRSENDEDEEGSSSILGAICCLSVMVTLYHHSYDLLVLIAPCFAIAANRLKWNRVSRFWRNVLLCCMTIPLLNYTTAGFIIDRFTERGDMLHRTLTSVNGVLILVATIVCCVLAWRQPSARAATE